MRKGRVPLAGVVLLAACAQDEPPPEPKEPQGRAETRAIRNTEAVGYGGNAIADKVDAGLEAQEKANREREAAAEE